MARKNESTYTLENVPLCESIYGKNLISLGGLKAIDNMFSDVDLTGLKVLDLGFGLGGVAFYLAKKYQIEVTGIEINDWMVEYAQSHMPKELASLLQFIAYNPAGEIPFKAQSFALVYSKGVLNHVHDKEHLFHQINKILKNDGLFVIADWIHPKYHKNNSSPLINETQKSYQDVLEKAGFSDIRFRDDSQIFLTYVKELIVRITENRQSIENRYGTEIVSVIEKDHQKLIEDIRQKQKFAVRILAKKCIS